MSREILFKAKRTDTGEWVKGAYSRFYENSGKLLHMIFVNYENEKRSQPVDIDPSTLCQYTGLTDKNGKKIWENDIVSCSDKMIVTWEENLASFCLSKKGWMYEHFFGEAVNAVDVEDIGNIFDNPELLEGGAE